MSERLSANNEHPSVMGAQPMRDGRDGSVLGIYLGGPLRNWAPAGVSPYPLIHLTEGQPLIHEGTAARSIYLVQAGEFKIVCTAEDGYEQVLDFAGRGDVLGFDGMACGLHQQGAMALEDAWVYALPVSELHALWHRVPSFASELQTALGRQIARSGELAWLTAAVGADRRTARFVLHWSRRMAQRGQSGRRLLLRMSRRDIASHLGLAHESVSRSFTELADLGLLSVDNRKIEILDEPGLRQFALWTRGPVDGVAARACARRATHDAVGAAGAAAAA
jgi:CRP/FNR family transcriptional regulator